MTNHRQQHTEWGKAGSTSAKTGMPTLIVLIQYSMEVLARIIRQDKKNQRDTNRKEGNDMILYIGEPKGITQRLL